LLTYLIADAGAGAVADALLLIGWGLLPVTAFHGLPLVISTLSWREMLEAAGRPGLGTLILVRWIRESVNNLLPVGQVGGELVGARLVHQRGVSGASALGSVVVDLTVGLLSQMVFVVIGLVVLVSYSTAPDVLAVVWSVLAGMGIFLLCLLGFFVFQQHGMMRFGAKIAGGLLKAGTKDHLVDRAGDVDKTIRAIYRSPRIWRASGIRLVGWLSGAGEIWLIMYFLGKPIGIGEALVLEALITGIRSAAFLVPGAIGIQEGAAIIFGSLFGISTADSLAISLGKRVREILLGVPGLISWQVLEGRHLIDRKAS
jgi:putative membrane protein